MRIIETYDVYLSGSTTHNVKPSEATYKIQDDAGKVFEVSFPDHKALTEAFQWLSDHDCLRYLIALTPDYEDNINEINRVEHANAMREEHAYVTGSVSYKIDPISYNKEVFVSGLEPLPDLKWQARWTFRSKTHALAFKVAMRL